MTTAEVLLVLAAILNFGWGFHNFQLKMQLDELIERAKKNVERSQRLSKIATVEQEHKVCSECERIVTKHSTDENGKTTCVNCAANLATKVN